MKEFQFVRNGIASLSAAARHANLVPEEAFQITVSQEFMMWLRHNAPLSVEIFAVPRSVLQPNPPIEVVRVDGIDIMEARLR